MLHLFKQADYQDQHISTTTLDHSRDSEGWADFHHNQERLWQGIKPLVLNWMLIPEQEFDLLYQQAIAEVYADDFTEVGQIVSIWSRKPAEK